MILLRWRRDLNPCTRLCRPLPRLSATPPRGDAFGGLRADDGTRTRDPHLGKAMRYQLRYVRVPPEYRVTDENSIPARGRLPNRISSGESPARAPATRPRSTAARRRAAVPD